MSRIGGELVMMLIVLRSSIIGQWMVGCRVLYCTIMVQCSPFRRSLDGQTCRLLDDSRVCRVAVRVGQWFGGGSGAESRRTDGASTDKKRKCQTEANMSAPMVKVRKTPI